MNPFRQKKSLICVIIALSIIFPLILSCEGKPVEKSVGGSECAVYSASPTAKILQNDDLSKSEEVLSSPEVYMCAGESESVQLILSAKEDIAEYEVTVGSLKNENGDTIADNSVELFVIKYHNVTLSSKYSIITEKGYYPDAMLPYNVACAYGENSIDAGKNQSVYIRLSIPTEQKSGKYSGKITVKTGKKTQVLNLTVNVYDISLNERMFRSCFDLRMSELIPYTLDISVEKYAKYYEDMLAYDMCAFFLPGYDDMDPYAYLEQIKKYWDNPHFNAYGIPVRFLQGTDIDAGLLAKYLEVIALAGETDGKNYLSKAYLYLTLIDEPQSRNIMPLCKTISERVLVAKQTAVENIEDYGLAKDFESVKNAILNVPHIVTDEYVPELNELIEIFCPTFDKYDEPYKNDIYKNLYESGRELWWYGCVNPGNPYPSYHIDERFISGRLAQWMAMKNGVVGNLYWDMTFPISIDGMRNVLGTSDFYNGVPNRYFNANGDGYMCYPGELYGIDGLVASVRMDGYRDGVEDYQAFVTLKELYEENGYEVKGILNAISDGLYSGTRYFCDSVTFERARRNLLDCIMLAKKGVFLTEFDYIDGKSALTVYSKIDGATINGKGVEKNKTHVYSADGSDRIEIKAEGITVLLKTRRTKSEVLIDEQSQSLIKGFNGVDVEFSSLSGKSAVIAQFNGGNDKSGYIKVGGSDIAAITKDDVIRLYIYAEKPTSMRLSVESTKTPVFSSIYTYNLNEGMNVVEVGAFAFFNFGKYGNIKNLCLFVNEQGVESVRAGITGYAVYSRCKR